MEMKEYYIPDNSITNINYPLVANPEKVTSTNFEKSPQVGGVLQGIKGQYLIFADNTVLNIRTHSGYKITLEA